MWFRRYLISWNLVHTKSSTFKVTNDQCCSFYFSIVGISGWTFKHWLKASNIALCLRNVNFVLCHIVCNQIYFLHATACVQRPAQKRGGGNQAAHICPPRFCRFKRFLTNIFFHWQPWRKNYWPIHFYIHAARPDCESILFPKNVFLVRPRTIVNLSRCGYRT